MAKRNRSSMATEHVYPNLVVSMHHLYPAVKGDPLCPLGFHPQVRWPTRCKRCFRDYKEHGTRKELDTKSTLRKDDASASTPSLSNWSSSSSRSRDDSRSSQDSGLGVSSRSSWSSGSTSSASSTSSNDSDARSSTTDSSRFAQRPASWTSTPDLGKLSESTHGEVTTVSFTLPRRRPQPADTGQKAASSPAPAPAPAPAAATREADKGSDSFTVRRRSGSSAETSEAAKTASSSSSAAMRSRRGAAAEKADKDKDKDKTEKAEAAARQRRVRIQSFKEVHSVEEPTNPEVEFIIQVKSSKKKTPNTNDLSNNLKVPSMKVTSSSSSGTSSDDEEDSDDATSTAGTETTETTLIDRNESELQEQIESLKLELETSKSRCDRLEREKSDLLLRRIASIDMPASRMSSTEANRLQQKINELTTQLEDMRDDKKSLSLRVKELEQEMDSRPDKAATQRAMDDLRSKLLAAETLCEELMDENEDMKRELRDLEEEIEEMQDNFREDQADEYTSLKKELEQTTKNCRILSFKLRKAERKTETLEAEKLELEGKCRQIAGGQTGLEKIEKITKLEHDLSVANEVASRLQKELDETKEKLKEKEEAASKVEATVTKKKAPKLADMSGHLRVSRESLTRGGSQEDPAQLLRDLQDAMEREADLREQLRFAEEEAQTLRKKTARMEDDNESLVLQLKKMATKARSRIKSPSPARMTPEPATEKDEGIAEEDDPAELRLQLELNEQEAAVLRRKVDELEKEGDKLKKKVKDLQDKLNTKPTKKLSASSIVTPEPGKGNAVYEQKIKVLEEELSECRMKLIEKERDVERLHAELTLTQKRSKGSIQKSKSLDSGNEQQALDLKRQLQVIEQEANILKSKNQALESENEKLSTENKRLVLLRGAKKPTGDNSTEMKEKVTALETELSEAKNKIKELEGKEDSENKTDEKSGEKNTKENADEIKKLKGDLSKIESENQKLSETLRRLKDESCAAALKFYKQRTPKKPTDLTSKVQLKKMVEDLESEIGEVLVTLKKSEMEKSKLKTSKTAGEDVSLKETKEKLETAQKKVESLEKELKQEREKSEKEKNKLTKDKKSAEEEKKKLEDLSKKLEEEKKNIETQGKKIEDSKKKIEDENKKLISEKDKLLEEKNKLEEQITKLSAEKAAAMAKQDEMTVFIQRVETLKKELEDEQKQGVELRKKLEIAQKAEQEKIKLQKEVAEKSSKLADSDKKVKEIEEKLKKSERLLISNKKKVVNLEKELTEEKEHAKANEATQQGVAASWLAERDDLKQQIASLQSKIDSQEIALSGKTVLIEQLEANIKEERERVSDVSKKAGVAERQELNALKDELTTTKSRLQEITQTLEKVEANKKSSEVKFKKQENELKKERDDFEKKASELEMDLQAERKKIERMKITQEKEAKNRETELATLRTKIRSLESNSNVSKKTAELQQEYESRIRKLEDELSGERQEYEDLTAKYEILEEEHVVTKAQLVMEKETLQSQLHSTKREMGSVENELRTLRETYNTKQDSWIKEKLDQQEKLKELEEKVSRSINNEALNIEKARSRAAIDEKNIEIEHLRREAEVLADQMNHIKRENDDLKKKMEDFNKVVKIQRNMTADTSALEKEVRDLKNKLFQEEKTHKSEMAQLKMRYDSQVAVVGEELQSLQGQVSRFKRERDTFRHMLEGAQKTIADLKASQPSRDSQPSSSASGEETEDTLTKIATLEQQINCMEDELSEARLESSKLKTELVSERSSWEIKLSELQSRVNELEEERILTSGRTKIPGMRTRMELAWSKEREELQRLLQETSTLARDLRQTLFEVERERDKERLESKRRIDQLKKTTEEEVDENKKKVTELQCDLLELRDAHAKLRTTNEKLRREKERHEKEREELRQLASGKRRAEQDEERRINSLLDQVDELMRLAPELFQNKQASSDSGITTPTPPRRIKGPKSRESSPGLERKDYSRETSVDRKVQLQSTVQRLTEATDALRRYQKAGEEDRDRERARRALGMRRAASTESDNPPETTLRPLGKSSRTSAQKASLHRKALSLEQTSAQEQQSIWKTDDEGDGSLSSLQSVGSTDSRFYSLNRKDNSMDSRLSGGSTQSEFVSGEKKKKKGILGKLKQLTKSRSIDDTTTARDYMSSQGSLGGSGSDISMGGDEKGSKKDLRDRLTGMFKKPSSRANSVERGKKEPSPALPERMDSIQRPLVRNGSSSTLPRPSPARSDVSTSSVSRPLVPGKSSTPSTTTSTIRRVK